MNTFILSIIMLIIAIIISQMFYKSFEGLSRRQRAHRRWVRRLEQERRLLQEKVRRQQMANEEKYTKFKKEMQKSKGMESNYSKYLEKLFGKYLDESIRKQEFDEDIGALSFKDISENMENQTDSITKITKQIKLMNTEIDEFKKLLERNRKKRKESIEGFTFNLSSYIKRIRTNINKAIKKRFGKNNRISKRNKKKIIETITSPNDELKVILKEATAFLNNRNIETIVKLYGASEIMKLIAEYEGVNHNKIMSTYGLNKETTGKLKQLLIHAKHIDETTFSNHNMDPNSKLFTYNIKPQITELRTELKDILKLIP